MKVAIWPVAVILAGFLALFPPLAAPSTLLGCGPSTAYASHVGCCKYCSTGKACGNTCIARWKTCHVGHGCACNAMTKVTDLALSASGEPIAR